MSSDTDQFEEDRQLLLLKKPDPERNPMVIKFGKGPAFTQCQECEHLVYQEFSKKYYKCKLRGITRGAGTDHRVRWQACAKFKKQETP